MMPRVTRMPPLTRWQRLVLRLFPAVRREIAEQDRRIERTAAVTARVSSVTARLSPSRVTRDYRAAPWPRLR